MTLPASQALWFLPFVLPICLWVAFNDMKFMKIPNLAVLTLTLVFLIVGLIAVPLAEYPWRLLQLVLVLVIGFFLNLLGLIGAGDAKFAAAMAPFVPAADATPFFFLLASVAMAAFVTHRVFRAIPAIRARSETWASWTRRDFPMGLPLGAALAFYLVLALYGGA